MNIIAKLTVMLLISPCIYAFANEKNVAISNQQKTQEEALDNLINEYSTIVDQIETDENIQEKITQTSSTANVEEVRSDLFQLLTIQKETNS